MSLWVIGPHALDAWVAILTEPTESNRPARRERRNLWRHLTLAVWAGAGIIRLRIRAAHPVTDAPA